MTSNYEWETVADTSTLKIWISKVSHIPILTIPAIKNGSKRVTSVPFLKYELILDFD